MKQNQPKNIIYYGVSGTGKTHKLQQLMQEYTDSLVSTDLLEIRIHGLSWREVICLVLLDVVNGQASGKLTLEQIVEHQFVKIKNSKNKNQRTTIDKELHRFSNPDSTSISREKITYASNYFFDKEENEQWYLLPEILPQLLELQHLLKQKSPAFQNDTIKIQRYAFVSFHQSYGYEEFVEGLKPIIDKDSKQITYQVQQGVFITLCEQAKNNPSQRYAMFIDEINRANVSKVFGELLTLIEPNKRAGMTHSMSVKLAYSAKNFTVPSNVDIYATMNMADRSLTPLDSAMRRRFEFIEIAPKHSVLSKDIEGVNLNVLLQALNLRIATLMSPDFVIGHAPFLEVDGLYALNQVMAKQIIPLLQEYSFNDWHMVRQVLADEEKSVAEQFIQQNTDSLKLNLPVNRPLYQVNVDILMLDKCSYLPIYQGLLENIKIT